MAEDKVEIADLKDAAKKYWSELAYAPGGVIKDMDYSHEVRKQVLETNAVKLYNLPF